MRFRSEKVPILLLVVVAATIVNSVQFVSADIIGNLIDNIACRRTTNRGYYGQCVPKTCCASTVAVSGLCLSGQTTCCYGEDICEEERLRYPPNRIPYPGPSQNDRYPPNQLPYPGPNDRYPPSNPIDRDYCSRTIISRYQWDANPSRSRPVRLPSRVEHVIVHHTGDERDACWSYDDCRYRVRQLQHYHQREKRFPDIPWNFLITDNGDIFEGVGWDVQGYHTERWNDRSIGVAFIGDFDLTRPTSKALRAFQSLLDCAVEGRYLDPYYGLYGHRDMRPTDCPGDLLYEEIRHMKAFRKFGSIDFRAMKLNPNVTEVTNSTVGNNNQYSDGIKLNL